MIFEQILLWLNTLPWLLKVICFSFLVVIQVVIAIIPGEPFELASGYLFGFWEGTILCLVSGMVGTLIIYWIVSLWKEKVIEKIFSKESIEKAERIMRHPTAKYGWILLYMIPGTPKDIICYLAPLLKIPLLPWLCISTIGRIPSVITSTGLVMYVMEGQWFYVGYLLVGIGIFALLGTFVNKKLGG